MNKGMRASIPAFILISSLVLASFQASGYTTPVQIDGGALDMFLISTAMSAQRNLVRLSNDTLLCVYLDEGWELSYATSEDDGVSWTTHDMIGYDPAENIGILSIARDSTDIVWCAYEYYDGEEDNEMILFTAYWEGGWSFPFYVDIPGPDENQYNPFVAVNSTDEIFIVWAEDNGTDSYIELLNFSIEQLPFDMPEPSVVNVTEEESEEFKPVLAFDGNDTVHIAYNYENDTSNSTIKYTNRTVGSDEFAPVVNISMGDEYDNLFPSICVDDDGTVYVAFVYGNMTEEFGVGLFYGDPPTNSLDIAGELDYRSDSFDLSTAWHDDELHILHDDYYTYMIAHVHGVPGGEWNLTTSITAPNVGENYHIFPSLRWAYYHEPSDDLDYVFTEMYEPGEGFGIFYQDITGVDPVVPEDIMDQISTLTQTVMSIFMLVVVLIVVKGVVMSMKRTFGRASF